jgi:hypothetical protein
LPPRGKADRAAVDQGRDPLEIAGVADRVRLLPRPEGAGDSQRVGGGEGAVRLGDEVDAGDPADLPIGVAPGQLDEAAAAESIAVAGSFVAIAIAVGVDVVGQRLRVVRERAGEGVGLRRPRPRHREARRPHGRHARGRVAQLLARHGAAARFVADLRHEKVDPLGRARDPEFPEQRHDLLRQRRQHRKRTGRKQRLQLVDSDHAPRPFPPCPIRGEVMGTHQEQKVKR